MFATDPRYSGSLEGAVMSRVANLGNEYRYRQTAWLSGSLSDPLQYVSAQVSGAPSDAVAHWMQWGDTPAGVERTSWQRSTGLSVPAMPRDHG